MAYVEPNYRSKRALKDALKEGKRVTVFQPGPFAPPTPLNGRVFLEGPHYPEPHKWYAEGVAEDGRLISVE